MFSSTTTLLLLPLLAAPALSQVVQQYSYTQEPVASLLVPFATNTPPFGHFSRTANIIGLDLQQAQAQVSPLHT